MTNSKGRQHENRGLPFETLRSDEVLSVQGRTKRHDAVKKLVASADCLRPPQVSAFEGRIEV